ncbi:9196_t:CDS:2 [Diversispora eburnea]|uniref:9196_t:CDS:1 n=1 Tax=Diversispora eburnea TaxID=1213867 RepID=A0A9N8VAJ9_9GLOM|nr:9196_t:CDS:2 [Diversispora eburnea]
MAIFNNDETLSGQPWQCILPHNLNNGNTSIENNLIETTTLVSTNTFSKFDTINLSSPSLMITTKTSQILINNTVNPTQIPSSNSITHHLFIISSIINSQSNFPSTTSNQNNNSNLSLITPTSSVNTLITSTSTINSVTTTTNYLLNPIIITSTKTINNISSASPTSIISIGSLFPKTSTMTNTTEESKNYSINISLSKLVNQICTLRMLDILLGWFNPLFFFLMSWVIMLDLDDYCIDGIFDRVKNRKRGGYMMLGIPKDDLILRYGVTKYGINFIRSLNMEDGQWKKNILLIELASKYKHDWAQILITLSNM